MQDYHQPLIPLETYHLFSRAVGDEKLFLAEKNYYYFLQKLGVHLGRICDVFTYALLPNHFHLLVRIKSFENIMVEFELAKKRKFDPLKHDLPDFIMERFSNFLNSYSKSINKMYHRKGALFMDYMKRTRVEDDSDFTSFLFYVHKNAVHHGYTRQIGDWKFDGYNAILSDKPTGLLREEVLQWFGGKDRFIDFHKQPIAVKNNFSDL